MRPLRIALTKGRLEKDTVALFGRMGYDTTALVEKGRRLILPVPGRNLEVVLAKAADVITYVEHGVCDAGIVGKDTILEQGRSFYEVLDLGFGRCRFALAARKGAEVFAGYRTKRIATKYPRVAREYFDKKGMDVEIIKIEGSVELAPLLGLSDAICGYRRNGRHAARKRPRGRGGHHARLGASDCEHCEHEAAQGRGGASARRHRRLSLKEAR